MKLKIDYLLQAILITGGIALAFFIAESIKEIQIIRKDKEKVDENTHKKHFNVAYGHYNNTSDKIPVLLIETSSWSERIAYIKMNFMLIKRFDIWLNKNYII